MMESVSQPTSFLEDFRKCIENFEEGEALKNDNAGGADGNEPFEDMMESEQTQKQILLSALSASNNVKSEDLESRHQENRKKRLDESLSQGGGGSSPDSSSQASGAAPQEQISTTRYNIITGGIYQQGSEGTEGSDDQLNPFIDHNSSEVDNPGSPMNLKLPKGRKGYSCKVCFKMFASRSGLRKHICRQEDEEEGMSQINGYAEGKVDEGDLGIVVKTEREDEGGEMTIVEGIKQSPLMATQRKDLAPIPEMQYPDVEAMEARPPSAAEGEEAIGNIDIKTEPGQLFMCPICSMTFTQASVLTRHYRAHSNERPHECKDCHKAFRRKCHLKRHWQRIHSGEKPFKCGICSKAFSDRDHQRQHETIHGPETYPCLRCRSVYPTEQYLAAHVGEHPDCKAAFAASADNQIKRMRATKTKGMPGSYRCGLCGDYFKKLRQIQTHQRVRHHDAFEKKYKCNICQKGFDLISDLTHHRSSHVLRGSKYDLDKEQPKHHSTPSTGRKAKLDGSSDGGPGENKAELMQMLQQLEKRIQMQERRVQQMEHRQENLAEEYVDGSEFDTDNDDLGSRLRYMLERPPEGQEGFDEGYTGLHGENAALDYSFKRGRDGESNGITEELFLDGAGGGIGMNGIGAQTKAVLDLMFKNRHKCTECGLSFLLYSEFRDHRKRHERARAAFGIEGEGASERGATAAVTAAVGDDEKKESSQEMIGSNPDGDRNLCRDCCNENGPHSEHIHSHRDTEQADAGDAPSSSAPVEGATSPKVATRSSTRIRKTPKKDSPYVSVLMKSESCSRCRTYLEELQQEREDRMLLQDEVEGLRDVLIQFANFASRYPSLDNQLLSLLQKNHSRLSKTLPSPEGSPE